MNDLHRTATPPFHGWRVVAAAFVLAVLGWGLGFYGPPIYLHAVREARGWSVSLISAAITVHYVCGAGVIAGLPRLYRVFGLVTVTRVGTCLLAAGLVGWASATAPIELFAATVLTGVGWVTLGAAAINAIVSPWFVTLRPKALSTAYNGASVGGIVFAPVWTQLIGRVGFQAAALLVGAVAIVIVFWLTASVVGRTPIEMGQEADGGAAANAAAPDLNAVPALPGKALVVSWRFRTLAVGMALGLFAQIGLLAHLFALIVPALGVGWSGLVASLATAAAIAGRTLVGWLMPEGGDRRLWAAASYGVQIMGILMLAVSGLHAPWLILTGVVLFGFGIGNATSLPPLIAQTEFARQDVARAVPLIVAFAQAAYAFAPALFGVIRDTWDGTALPLFATATGIMVLAVVAFLAGRRR